MFSAVNEFKQGQRISPILETHYLSELDQLIAKHPDAKDHQYEMGDYLASHPPKGKERTAAALLRTYRAVTQKEKPAPKNLRTRNTKASITEDLGAAWDHAVGPARWR